MVRRIYMLCDGTFGSVCIDGGVGQAKLKPAMWYAFPEQILIGMKFPAMHVLLNSEQDGRKDSTERVLRNYNDQPMHDVVII